MSDHPSRPSAAPVTLRSWLLVAGPVVVAVLWALGLLPAWGAAALATGMSVLAVVDFLRLRRVAPEQGVPGAHVLVVGGGYAGLVAARALQARLPGGTRGGRHLGARAASPGVAAITVVDPQAHMTYQPFLPEAAAGAIEPRHLMVGLRRVLRRCDVLTGSVAAIDDARRRAVVSFADGSTRELSYDVLVVAPGTAPRELPIPGLAERALGFRSVTDALALRDHVLSRLDAAASTTDPSRRRALLTFTVVGGGFAGLEALGELEDMTRRAAKHHPAFVGEEVRWVLLEAAGRIMPEVGPALAARVHAQLVRRGVDVRVGARLQSVEGGRMVLGGGGAYDSDTVVVAAGTVGNPLLERTDLPLDACGRVLCTTTLQVLERPHVFTAGDCAAVPDSTRPDRDATTAPTAQHAVRQARLLARNVDSYLGGRLLRGYRHRHAGSVAGLGRRRGAAEIGRFRFTGWPAWFLHRAYHLWAVPTADRTVRIALDWLVTAVMGRDLVAVGRRERTRATTHPVAAVDPVPAVPDDPGHDPGHVAPVDPAQAIPGESPSERTVVTGTVAVPDPVPRRDVPPVREPHPSGPLTWGVAAPLGGEPRDDGTRRGPVPSGVVLREPHPSMPALAFLPSTAPGRHEWLASASHDPHSGRLPAVDLREADPLSGPLPIDRSPTDHSRS